MILTMIETCQDPALANSLLLVKKFLSFVQLIGPIIGMVGLTIHLIKLFVNPENKKHKSLITNWIMAILLLFFFPGLINTFMYLLDDSFELTRCWNYAEQAAPGYSSSIDGYEEEDNRVPIIVNPGSLDDILGNSDKKSTFEVYFIGDSRTCGMKNSISKDINWVCKDSQGLKWFMNTAVPSVEDNFNNNNRIVILLGVNDLGNASNYVSYINSKAKEWKKEGAYIYFVSVNPTDGKYSNLNSKIDSFNTTLKNGLSSDVKYIDTNSYLKSVGFTTTDGLHYNSNTYKLIYNKVIINLGN